MALPPQEPLLTSRGRPAPRRRGRWVIVAVILLLVAAAAAWRIYDVSHATPAAARGGRRGGGPPGGPAGAGGDQQAVGVATAATGDIPIILSELGTVTPLATVTVKSQISGYLTQIAFREGQMVKKGDFLAQVDARAYEASLAQYQGQLLKDQAMLKNAELDLVRYQKLNAQDSISKQNVDTQAATVLQNRGLVKSDQAQVDAQRLNIAYAHIVSPVDGRVGLRQVDQGNYVTSGDSNGIVVVTQLEPISVVFTVPEDALPQVAKRMRAGEQLQVTLFDRSNTTQLGEGSVETVDNQIDTTTGTIKVRALFGNKDDLLFPNQFVNARLLVDTLRNAIVVPTAAIQRGTDGTFVYVVSEASTVAVRQVKTGAASSDKTAVLSGLKLGERVVTDGSDRLRDGQKVVVPGPAPAGGEAAGGQRGNGQRRARANPDGTGEGATGPAGSTAAADAATGSVTRGNPSTPTPPAPAAPASTPSAPAPANAAPAATKAGSGPAAGAETAQADGYAPPANVAPVPRRDPSRARRSAPADPSSGRAQREATAP